MLFILRSKLLYKNLTSRKSYSSWLSFRFTFDFTSVGFPFLGCLWVCEGYEDYFFSISYSLDTRLTLMPSSWNIFLN